MLYLIRPDLIFDAWIDGLAAPGLLFLGNYLVTSSYSQKKRVNYRLVLNRSLVMYDWFFIYRNSGLVAVDRNIHTLAC